MAEKEWRVDILPILFFGFLVIAKTYSLVEYLQTNDRIWNLVADATSREAAGSGTSYYLTGQFSFLAYFWFFLDPCG